MTHGLQNTLEQTQELSASALTSMRFLRHRLEQASQQIADRSSYLIRAAQLLTSAIGQDCIAWVEISEQSSRITGLNMPAEGLSESIQQAITERAAEAIRTSITHVSVLSETETLNCICAPVAANRPAALVILHSGQKNTLPFAVASAELVASSIYAAECRREAGLAAIEAQEAGGLVDLLARTEAAVDHATSLHTLCCELQQMFQCVEVVIGLTPSPKEIVTFEARTERGDLTDDLRLAINAALHESMMQADVVKFPPPAGAPRHALLAHRQLASESSADTIISSPLRTEDGQPQGAIALIGRGDELNDDRASAFLRAAEPRIAATIALLARSERHGIERLAGKIQTIAADHKSRMILAGVAVVCLLMCIPLPYKVRANCELQPLNHRYVSAPFEAPLETCLVEPGDIVEPGQLLATIDGREIRMQLAEIASDRNRAAKERDMHRAKGEYGSAGVARLQMQAHQARAELLEYRGQNLEVRSPSAGVVVSGDWKKSEGVKLSMGETMFEIAPLDRMIVEVGIPEDDITHIEVGQSVTVHMDAYAGESWTGKLLRVHPAAEIRDSEHVFIGEFELENQNLRLRPGMRGKAKITTSAKPLVWNLFHKPWNAFVAWLRYSI